MSNKQSNAARNNTFMGKKGCFVIAEVGINHGGDLELCKQMISAAANTGADAVKLQSANADHSYHPDTLSYELFKGMEFTEQQLMSLMQHARDRETCLFSTPGDFYSLQLTEKVNMPLYKISSGLLSNLPLLEKVASSGKPVIVSTGMAEYTNIQAAYDVLVKHKTPQIAILQCTSLYPTPADQINLSVMDRLTNTYDATIGFSCHYDGIEACVAAVARGARVIEKHFTTDKNLPGGDNTTSIEPDLFAEMVRQIRLVETFIGDQDNKPVEAERTQSRRMLRKIVAARDLETGCVVSIDDVYFLRVPEHIDGINARDWESIKGQELRSAKAASATFLPNDFVAGI